MNKKLIILFISTLSLCFAQDLNSIYKNAKELEDSGDYKSAMLLYKKTRHAETTPKKNNTIILKNINKTKKKKKKEEKKKKKK